MTSNKTSDGAAGSDPSEHHELTPSEMDMIGQLIRNSGQREAIPELVERRVYAKVEAAFREATAARRRLKTRLWAMAAAVLVAIGAGIAMQMTLGPQPVGDPVSFARVSVVRGAPVADGAALGVGAAVDIGSALETGVGARLTLILGDGATIRLDEKSRLTVQSADRLELVRGAVYVDSGPKAVASNRVVVTPFGDVHELGTQFEVRSAPDVLRVAVREGSVELKKAGIDANRLQAETGLDLRADGSVRFFDIEASDNYWAWAETMAPQFTLEAATVYDYLVWVARETGRELVISQDKSSQALKNSQLHGSIEGLSPEDSLAVVLPTTRFASDIVVSKTTIRIR